MPTKNNETWKNQGSSFSSYSIFFDKQAGEEKLEEVTPDVNKIKPTAPDHRQILNLLLMIDVSGSMRGQRIGSVNYALENVFRELRKRDDSNSVIKVGIMHFSEDAQWITPKPILLDDYVFTKIEAQPWLTNYGAAFEQLGKKLSRKAFMDPALGEYYAPVIMFVTDGEPTDVAEYPEQLKKLSRNGWFKQSARYAIATGEEARNPEVMRVLAEFTGDQMNVRYADDGDALCDLIQYVAIRASEVQTSMLTGDRSKDKVFDKKDANFLTLFDA